MRQLAIDLPYRPAFGRADFLVSACNARRFGWIERWPDWPTRALVLYGPPRSGKSHLAHLWRERSGGVLVAGDGLAQAEPNELATAAPSRSTRPRARPSGACCTCTIAAVEAGAGLLLAAREAPASWKLALPDLASRLRAMPAVAIAPPDEALLGRRAGQAFRRPAAARQAAGRSRFWWTGWSARSPPPRCWPSGSTA